MNRPSISAGYASCFLVASVMLAHRSFQSILLACISAGCAGSRLPPSDAAHPAPAAGPTPAAQSAAPQLADPQQSAPAAAPSAAADAAPAAECKLYCEPARMVARPAPDPDYTQHEIDNASAVLASMTDDLLGCYKTRLRANPQAHGFITVDILIGSDGHVRKVDTTGGAILGEITMACIVRRIERGVFEPPHGGGNIHVQMPFSLRVVGPDDFT